MSCYYRFLKLWKDLQVRRLVGQIPVAYKIIPLGTNCLPRCITTFSGIKPTREQGEKSLPFDLAFYDNLSKNIHLLDTNFKDFYKGLQYDKKKKWYYNTSLQAVFNHDGMLSRQEFQKRYDARIQNLYDYIGDKKSHLFFVIADSHFVRKTTFERLMKVIGRYRKAENFDIIWLNQSGKTPQYTLPHLHIISIDGPLFDLINAKGNWAKELKKRRTKSAQDLYYPLVKGIIALIK